MTDNRRPSPGGSRERNAGLHRSAARAAACVAFVAVRHLACGAESPHTWLRYPQQDRDPLNLNSEVER
jgi:hypothetical protein